MRTIYLCISQEHDLRVVALAIALSVISAAGATIVGHRALRSRGRGRRNLALLAGGTLGLGFWATHFVAMLANLSPLVEGYYAVPMLLSLLVAVLGGMLAMLIMARSRTAGAAVLGALILSGSLLAMHYIGISSLRMNALAHWNLNYVRLSALAANLVTIAAMQVLRIARGIRLTALAAGLLACAAPAVHFTGMTALTILPSRVYGSGHVLSTTELASWTAGAGALLLVILAAVTVLARDSRHRSLSREKEFSLVLGRITDCAIYNLDTRGRIIAWNAGVRRLTGYEADEIIGMSLSRLYPVEDRALGLAHHALDCARETGTYQRATWCERKDGTRFWSCDAIETVRDDDGKLTGYVMISRDMTAQKRVAEQVEETTRLLETALDQMLQGVCMFDENDRLKMRNRRMNELYNMPEGACEPGMHLRDVIVCTSRYGLGEDPDEAQLESIVAFTRNLIDDPAADPIVTEFPDGRVMSMAVKRLPDGGWMSVTEDLTERCRSAERIQHMALHDGLTGLPNRIRFDQIVEHDLTRVRARGSRLAVFAIDLDRFKEINDTHGHAAGDHVLQVVAMRLARNLADYQHVARIGGDEFAASLAYADRHEVETFAASLMAAVIEPIEDGDQRYVLGASIGIALFPDNGIEREPLLKNADLAMYRAKSTLGKSICYYEPGMDEQARQRRQLGVDLRGAIDRGELSLMYQPQRSLVSDTLSGYEALLRWQHPVHGAVGPETFIPIAEETGEIFAIGLWVLREACMEARLWPEGLKVAVNLSPVQFQQAELIENLRTILVDTGLSPQRLELEITETAIISDKLRALHCLRQIKAMGVAVAIDDFGTGYSSLDTLHSFPFDKIKIDKSFLLRADKSPQARAIVKAVLALGKSLDIPVLAEGLENESQLSVLRSEGCDEAQGYYFGRPALAPSLSLPKIANG